ncbi:MAG: hypothetical protein UX21_C0007G0015 [Microgenomates group bacterium GW2011_GWC2_45_8]|nr:MAG: hypothetical protein UX21_C0007G0015 [Microgenomates group bacterium GW2011_GWC2_45_8]KKU26606.1 MAG: hypothetical protein UX37_C0001G0033 [Microgenomates group bacterium GW2011_GWA2_46_16]
MESFGDVGDGSAPTGVVAGLTGDYVGNNPWPDRDGGAGVVETGFDRQDGWLALHIPGIIQIWINAYSVK